MAKIRQYGGDFFVAGSAGLGETLDCEQWELPGEDLMKSESYLQIGRFIANFMADGWSAVEDLPE